MMRRMDGSFVTVSCGTLATLSRCHLGLLIPTRSSLGEASRRLEAVSGSGLDTSAATVMQDNMIDWMIIPTLEPTITA